MKEHRDGLIQETVFNPYEETMTVKVTYDNTQTLDENARLRNRSKSEQYKGNFVHVGSIDEGDVIRLKNLGYNLYSPDPEEWKRAMLYIQASEPHLLTVRGKPFAKKRNVWI